MGAEDGAGAYLLEGGGPAFDGGALYGDAPRGALSDGGPWLFCCSACGGGAYMLALADGVLETC